MWMGLNLWVTIQNGGINIHKSQLYDLFFSPVERTSSRLGTRVLTIAKKNGNAWHQMIGIRWNQNTKYQKPRFNKHMKTIPEKVHRTKIKRTAWLVGSSFHRLGKRPSALLRPSKQQRVRGLAASKCSGTLPRLAKPGWDGLVGKIWIGNLSDH